MSEATTTNDIVAIVPVKRREDAKSRLASRLSPAERARLVVVLLERVLGAIRAAGCVDRTLVISADAAIRDLAAANGAHVLGEPHPKGPEAPDARHNAALERAREAARAWRPRALLILSADLPLLGPSDVQALVALGETAGVVVAPDRRERGTNALFLRPADAIPFRFGSDSLRAHSEAAQARGHRVAIYRSPGTAFDLDEPEDLDRVMGVGGWVPGAVPRPSPGTQPPTPITQESQP